MISEKKFSVAYTSFWNTVAPLADRYVRLQNMQLERFDSPLGPGVPAQMRGVTNELGFRIFCTCYLEKSSVSDLNPPRLEELAKEATEYITRFREFSRRDVHSPDRAAIEEARVIAARLLHYYRNYTGGLSVLLRPDFAGCGILDACAGDVLVGNTLYEIKAAERSFRVVDLRQVLVYCALNYASGSHKIDHVAFLNPRMGTRYSQPVEQIASEVSGTTAGELFSEILEFLEQGYGAPGGDLS